MKKYLILLGISALLACNTGTKKHTALEDSLANVNAGIKNENQIKDSLLRNKEAALTEFVASFNEVQDNLNRIKENEKIITVSSKGSEFKKSSKDQIITDVQSIYDLLGKNKLKVANLSKKLKDSNLKIDELEKAINNLSVQLMDKETEITDLKNQLEKLNVDFKNLKMEYIEQKQESQLKTEKLNTAYYVVGTTKELKKNGIVTKEGGFIGIGRVTEMSTINPAYFTKIDITLVKEIPVSAKKVKLITNHPETSYKMVEGANSIIRIEITDPEQFWSISKYCIITADKKEGAE